MLVELGGQTDGTHGDAIGGPDGVVRDPVHRRDEPGQIAAAHEEDATHRQSVGDLLLAVVGLALQDVETRHALGQVFILVGGEVTNDLFEFVDDAHHQVGELPDAGEHLLLALLAHGIEGALQGTLARELLADLPHR